MKTIHFIEREQERGAVRGFLLSTLPSTRKDLKLKERGKKYLAIEKYSCGAKCVVEIEKNYKKYITLMR